VLEGQSVPSCLDRGDARARGDRAPGFLEAPSERFGDGEKIDDSGVGRVEGGDPGRRRLDRGDLFGALQSTQPGDAVRPGAALELVEAPQLGVFDGDDQLADAIVGDALGFAELIHKP
jgi:hypothetical protein